MNVLAAALWALLVAAIALWLWALSDARRRPPQEWARAGLSYRRWMIGLLVAGWVLGLAYRAYALPRLFQEVGGRVRASLAPEPGKESEERVLVADELVAGYIPEVNILDGCSLELRRGELVGVIGPNGAGKSTLVKVMFGLLPVRSGSMHLAGLDVTGKPAHELVSLGVGYVPQVSNVFPTLTVRENLEMGVYLEPVELEGRLETVVDLFPLLGQRASQRTGSLSGGERQMVAMARALMTDPAVLLLDEPSAGLSPSMQDQVLERVQEINGAGVSIVMVEQNARRCLEICHRGYVLDQGRNAYTGLGDELLEDPKVIDLYLGTLAKVD